MNLRKWCALIGLWGFLTCTFAQGSAVFRLVVPFPAGGSLDRLARMLAQDLTVRMGQTFWVENRPGADGVLAAEHVLRNANSDKMLLMVNPALASNYVSGRFKLDPLQSFKPVVQLGETEVWFVARSNFPWPNLQSWLAQLRQGGQKLSCAGPPGQLGQACDLLSRAFPSQIVAVPFQGEAPAMQAVLGGHVDFMLATKTVANDLIQSGRLRLLATAGRQRAGPPLEQVDWLGASLPELQIVTYMGVFAPASTDDIEVARLNQFINDSLRSEAFVRFMQASHIHAVGGAPGVMRETFVQNVERQKLWQLPRDR